jgi:probable HAF family extracellular repeat protein
VTAILSQWKRPLFQQRSGTGEFELALDQRFQNRRQDRQSACGHRFLPRLKTALARTWTPHDQHPLAMKTKISLAAAFAFFAGFTCAAAQLSYTVTDLGTLGGTTSTANGVAGQQGHNAAGMIVGTSTASDGSDHAFLYTNGQMFDLNTLCDLSTSDFNVLTVAKTISDSCLIIGEGITSDGQKHAFLLTPLAVDGGQWSYNCCQWVWIQVGGGWWWETGCGCYKWHGPPHGKHPPCPPQPPHCWWWPLPCPPECGCTPPPPPPQCWCCINGELVQTTEADCLRRGGKCYGSKEEALKYCHGDQTCWCCINGELVQTTEADCLKRGGKCYGSKEEALKYCHGVGPTPPNPTPPPRQTPTPPQRTPTPPNWTPTPGRTPIDHQTPTPPPPNQIPTPFRRHTPSQTPTPSRRHTTNQTPTPSNYDTSKSRLQKPTPTRRRTPPNTRKQRPTPTPAIIR